MFTPQLVGLDIAHKRERREADNEAQAIIDSLDADIIMLRRALVQARADLARERGLRIAAQHRVEVLLDTEI